MSESAYQDYGCESAGPSNEADGDALAQLFREAALEIGNGLRVWDLGCGNGYMAAFLAQAGFDDLGVDASAKGIALAQKNFPQAEFRQIELGGDLAQAVGCDFDNIAGNH